MGEVFKVLCQYRQHPNQVERISGRVAIGLLSESKTKGCLPFAVFTETGKLWRDLFFGKLDSDYQNLHFLPFKIDKSYLVIFSVSE